MKLELLLNIEISNQIQSFGIDYLTMCTDMMIRALGYDYCNVMCFCKMEYRQQIVKGKMSIAWHESNMKDFGEYAIIVKNPKEFIRRLDKAISNKNYQYICGDVNYHPMTLNNKPVNNKHYIKILYVRSLLKKGILLHLLHQI